ncbi:MAG: LysR family transcriptional regulator [Chloroflexi bacterium]|nr:LysR family transcriptional regulator [Chloroflexota bacterium]
MELRQLEAFVEAARRGSISRAAQALYLTQPSLTQRVRALELDLGQQLLVRAGRGVKLTPAGHLFLPRAEAALGALRHGAEEVRLLRDLEGGRLAVGASPDVAAFVLPPALARFHREHPAVTIALTTAAPLALAALVLSEQIDLAITEGVSRLPDVAAGGLYDERLLAVAAPDHELAARESVTLADLTEAGLVMPATDTLLHEVIQDFFAGRDIAPKVAVYADTTETMKRLVAAGLGVALAPELSVREELRTGRLALLSIAKVRLPVRPLCALQREDAQASSAARALLRIVPAECLPRPARTRRPTATPVEETPAQKSSRPLGRRAAEAPAPPPPLPHAAQGVPPPPSPPRPGALPPA